MQDKPTLYYLDEDVPNELHRLVHLKNLNINLYDIKKLGASNLPHYVTREPTIVTDTDILECDKAREYILSLMPNPINHVTLLNPIDNALFLAITREDLISSNIWYHKVPILIAQISSQTPLVVAISYRNKNIIKYLINIGAITSLPDKFGFTASDYINTYMDTQDLALLLPILITHDPEGITVKKSYLNNIIDDFC